MHCKSSPPPPRSRRPGCSTCFELSGRAPPSAAGCHRPFSSSGAQRFPSLWAACPAPVQVDRSRLSTQTADQHPGMRASAPQQPRAHARTRRRALEHLRCCTLNACCITPPFSHMRPCSRAAPPRDAAEGKAAGHAALGCALHASLPRGGEGAQCVCGRRQHLVNRTRRGWGWGWHVGLCGPAKRAAWTAEQYRSRAPRPRPCGRLGAAPLGVERG